MRTCIVQLKIKAKLILEYEQKFYCLAMRNSHGTVQVPSHISQGAASPFPSQPQEIPQVPHALGSGPNYNFRTPTGPPLSLTPKFQTSTTVLQNYSSTSYTTCRIGLIANWDWTLSTYMSNLIHVVFLNVHLAKPIETLWYWSMVTA